MRPFVFYLVSDSQIIEVQILFFANQLEIKELKSLEDTDTKVSLVYGLSMVPLLKYDESHIGWYPDHAMLALGMFTFCLSPQKTNI